MPIGAAGAGLALTGGAAEDSNGSGSTATGPGSDSSQARAQDPAATRSPSFAWTLITILSPVALMLIRAAAGLWMDPKATLYPILQFIGDPVVALLVAVLLAMVTFGTTVGFSSSVLTKKIGQSLMPIVGVILIVGAGGGFKQVLVDGGTGTAIAKIAVAASLSALVLGWMVAVLIRLATGSATVATVTSAGIVAPLATHLAPVQLALVVLAIGGRLVVLLARERRGLLAGEGVLRDDCRTDDQDLVRDGDADLPDGPGPDPAVVP